MFQYFCHNILHECLIDLILVATEIILEDLQLCSLQQILKKTILEVKSGLEADCGKNSKNKGILILNLSDFHFFYWRRLRL